MDQSSKGGIVALRAVPDVPVLEAITVGNVKESGSSRPIAMYCESAGDASLSEYVVKLHEGDGWRKRLLTRELFGSLLAHVLGMTVPSPAVIEISPGLSDGVRDPDTQQRVFKSQGYNFGSETVPAGLYTADSTFVPEERAADAAGIFAFDMLIQNADRTPRKPNSFQSSTGYWLYDHEKAFPFAAPDNLLGGNVEPWELARLQVMVSGHLFFRALKGRVGLTFDSFISDLGELTNDVLSQIAQRIPPDWCDERTESDIRNINAQLAHARDNRDKFLRSLLEVLS